MPPGAYHVAVISRTPARAALALVVGLAALGCPAPGPEAPAPARSASDPLEPVPDAPPLVEVTSDGLGNTDAGRAPWDASEPPPDAGAGPWVTLAGPEDWQTVEGAADPWALLDVTDVVCKAGAAGPWFRLGLLVYEVVVADCRHVTVRAALPVDLPLGTPVHVLAGATPLGIIALGVQVTVAMGDPPRPLLDRLAATPSLTQEKWEVTEPLPEALSAGAPLWLTVTWIGGDPGPAGPADAPRHGGAAVWLATLEAKLDPAVP